jgi:hypothetical protein
MECGVVTTSALRGIFALAWHDEGAGEKIEDKAVKY